MQLFGAASGNADRAIASGTLEAPSSHFVCAGKQVFTKTRGNSSLNDNQKKEGTSRRPPDFVPAAFAANFS
jgi:hypothetical protein